MQRTANANIAFDVLTQSEQQHLITGEQALSESYNVLQFSSSSEMSRAVEKVALRFGAGSGQLAEIVRKDQDLGAQAEKLDTALISAVGRDPSDRSQIAEDQLRKRLADIGAERADILNVLSQKFPNYLALLKPPSMTAESTEFPS